MHTGRVGAAADRVWPLIALALGLVILGAAASSGHLFPNANPSDGSPRPSVSTSHSPSEVPSEIATTAPKPPVRGESTNWLAWAMVLTALFGLALAVAALLQWRLRRRSSAARVPPDGPPVAEASAANFADDVLQRARRAQEDVRTTSDVRDAVIAAYLAFEAAVAGAGVARLAHETSSELLTRVLRSILVPAEAAADLVALYERVRFGTATSDEGMRAEAQRCLAAIETALAGVVR
ncbi:MAG: hypothetical protein JWM93_40 [Frankiales bacterium]|nr:hypothetical protein [Frankiales bacterium]